MRSSASRAVLPCPCSPEMDCAAHREAARQRHVAEDAVARDGARARRPAARAATSTLSARSTRCWAMGVCPPPAIHSTARSASATSCTTRAPLRCTAAPSTTAADRDDFTIDRRAELRKRGSDVLGVGEGDGERVRDSGRLRRRREAELVDERVERRVEAPGRSWRAGERPPGVRPSGHSQATTAPYACSATSAGIVSSSCAR